MIFLIVFGGIGWLKYDSYVSAPVDADDSTKISFQVKTGESIKEIADNLEGAGLIRSSWAFYLYVRFHDLGEGVIAGRFLLDKTMNVPAIVSALSDVSKVEYVITVQEGLTVSDIDLKLMDLGLIKRGDFISAVKAFDGWQYYPFLDAEKLKTLKFPLEGYLFPDTYFLDPQDFKSSRLVYLMLDNFERKFLELGSAGGRTVHEIITMASIIEKEVNGDENRAKVSGILWKRLQNDWTLGADATILYVTDDNDLTSSDLEIDSPYNTRKNKGLPPGPICNPSVSSIEAAMFPSVSDFWFYLTVPGSGEVIYSKTNEEHNENKGKYL